MPSKYVSYVDGDTEQHVSYHFDTVQEMIDFERFQQDSTFEKYQQDQEVAREVVSNFIPKLKFPISYELRDDITPADIDFSLEKSCPWVIDWKKVEEDFGPEYKWFAVDEDGEKWVYADHPELCCDEEEGEGYFYLDSYGRGRSRVISSRYILQEGTVLWNESLVKKPEKS